MTPALSASAKLREWRENPVTFVRQCIGVEPDAWQEEGLNAALTHQRIAFKASKGPGKSTVLAWLGWWFLVTRLHPKVVATSISGDNLKDNLWTELAKWQGRSPLLKQAFRWGAERIVAVDHPETWWASARNWPKDADSTRQSDTLAGIHGDFVMFLIDESGGIPDAVVATAEAGLANADKARGTEALLIQAGNPTQTSGPLYRACTRERMLWKVIEINGDPDNPKRSPRVSVQWAREQIQKYGRHNPWVLVNVFGQFPPAQSNTLVGVELATESAKRDVPRDALQGQAKVLGVDVARFGDDKTVIQGRQGLVAFKPKDFRHNDTTQTTSQVAMAIDKWQPDAVFVDQTGVGGGVVDQLRQLGYPVFGIDNAGSPSDPRTFKNIRAEMWWKMAEWMKAGGSIPDDDELISELTAPTYSYTADQLIKLESKDEMKKRGLPSPDKADALALTFSMPVAPRGIHLPGMEGRVAARMEFDPYSEAAAGRARARTDFDPYFEGSF